MVESTLSTKTFNGIPVLVPNKITSRGDDFYVSYNNYDRGIYGCDTTAIVAKGNFFVLNGNHSKNLEGLDLRGALKYFVDNKDMHNDLSEKIDKKFAL